MCRLSFLHEGKIQIVSLPVEETAGAVFPEGRCPLGEKIKIVAGTCREFLLLAEFANSVGGAYVGWG